MDSPSAVICSINVSASSFVEIFTSTTTMEPRSTYDDGNSRNQDMSEVEAAKRRVRFESTVTLRIFESPEIASP